MHCSAHLQAWCAINPRMYGNTCIMLGSYITRQVINGTLSLVQTIRYSNGKITKRLLDPVTLIPQEIIE